LGHVYQHKEKVKSEGDSRFVSVLFALGLVNDMSPQKHSSLPDGVQVWIDGIAKVSENAQVSVFDRGFLYGDSVFETLRTYAGKPFALQEHILRLATSAERVLIQMPLSPAQMEEEVSRAVEASGFDDAFGIAFAGHAGVDEDGFAGGSDDESGGAAFDIDPIEVE
jgi:hypothetical protein